MTNPELNNHEDVEKFYKHLMERDALFMYTIKYPIVEHLLTKESRYIETINATENDSKLVHYQHDDGYQYWKVDHYGPDDIEGIAWFSHHFFLIPNTEIDELREADKWLGEHREAYSWLAPIKWSTAPEKSKEALEWLNQNRELWETSPAAKLFQNLFDEVFRVVEENKK